jgi:hypothetical protein
MLTIATIVLVTAETASVLAFDPKGEIDGVRVHTDKEVYGMGRDIRVSLYLVNKLDHTIGNCVSTRDLTFRGPLGLDGGLGHHIDYSGPDPQCGTIQPGSERFEATYEWSLPIPGVWTVEASMQITGQSSSTLNPSFKGSTTILVLPLA